MEDVERVFYSPTHNTSDLVFGSRLCSLLQCNNVDQCTSGSVLTKNCRKKQTFLDHSSLPTTQFQTPYFHASEGSRSDTAGFKSEQSPITFIVREPYSATVVLTNAKGHCFELMNRSCSRSVKALLLLSSSMHLKQTHHFLNSTGHIQLYSTRKSDQRAMMTLTDVCRSR